MSFFATLKKAAAVTAQVATQAAGIAMESTAGIRAQAASLAGSAFTEVKEAAGRALNKTDRFSPQDVDQAAEAMTISGLGLRAPDGSWQAATPEEMRGFSQVALAATLADDEDEDTTKVLEQSDI